MSVNRLTKPNAQIVAGIFGRMAGAASADIGMTQAETRSTIAAGRVKVGPATMARTVIGLTAASVRRG
jgi:hypothetical protein